MPWSSNATFLVELTLNGATGQAVYKPRRGERPLWDFPPALYRREIAAYLLSEALGWGLVPLTIEREGPYGDGSLQQLRARRLRAALLHAARERRAPRAPEADLSSSTCWRTTPIARAATVCSATTAICAIDNGLTFHVEPKLRTVIWDFSGEPIPAAWLADVRARGRGAAEGAGRAAQSRGAWSARASRACVDRRRRVSRRQLGNALPLAVGVTSALGTRVRRRLRRRRARWGAWGAPGAPHLNQITA